MKIFPSLISADLLSLRAVLERLDDCVDGYHLDVMDGHFVPNITWGPAFIAALRGATALPLQVHLMVTDPLFWLDRLELVSGDSVIFHIEALSPQAQAVELCQRIRQRGWRAGVALNPSTPITAIDGLLRHLDELLVMSVNPGFSGQKFIDISDKLSKLQLLLSALLPRPLVCVDGGVNRENISHLAQQGVEAVGAAGAIFFAGDWRENVAALRAAAVR